MTEKNPTPSRPSGSLWPLRCILTILVTLAGVQFSLRHGRLIYRPMADDANYLVDGLLRLRILDHEGWMGFIASFMSNPPHAPFSSILAMGSFALLGQHDWAPYAGNGLIVLMLLVMVDRILGNARLWQRLMAYLLVLSTRLPMTAIVQFRPDIAAGLVTAFTVLMISNESLLTSPVKWRLRIGILIGLSLLIKPTLAPVNGIILAAAILWQIPGTPPRAAAKKLMPVALIALFVCLPYYAFGLRPTVEYIYANIFGSRREIWQYNASWPRQILYYIAGPGSDFLLGTVHTFILLALYAVGISLNFRNADEGRRRLYGFALVTFLAFLLPAVCKAKNGYVGATFHCLLLLGAVAGLRQLFQTRKKPALAFAVLAVLIALLLFQWPVAMGDPNVDPALSSNRLLNQVYAQIETGQPGDRIFVPAPGKSVSWNTMNYLALIDDSLCRFVNLDYGRWDDRELIDTELDQADWVVIGDEGNDEARMDLPNNKFGLPIYLDAVKKRSDFSEATEFPAYTQLQYHIFQRTTPAFSGFDSVDGFLPEDGPHPEWKLPRIRAAYGPTSHIRFTLPTPGRRIVVLSFASPRQNQEVSVWMDGNKLATQPCDNENDFTDIRLDLNLPLGNVDLELGYKLAAPPGAPKPAAIFKKIQVLGGP